MQWYCYARGQHHGPLDDDVLRDWVRQGKIGPDDRLWAEGMPAWVPAASALPEAFADAPKGPPPIPTVAARQRGTAGRTPNGHLTRAARRRLRGHWGLPAAFYLLCSLIAAGPAVLATIVPIVGLAIGLIVTGPLTLSFTIFFLTFARGGRADDMMFGGFRRFGTAVEAIFLMVLFVWLWAMLGALPGAVVFAAGAGGIAGTHIKPDPVDLLFMLAVTIIPATIVAIHVSLSYSQTFYVLADNEEVDSLRAIRQSKKIMRGRKAKLFCLHLRFLAWLLLTPLAVTTLVFLIASLSRESLSILWSDHRRQLLPLLPYVGFLAQIGALIPLLVIGPYMQTSLALFYDDLQPR